MTDLGLSMSFRLRFKQGFFTLQTSLLCIANKTSLRCKQGFFWNPTCNAYTPTRLLWLYNARKPCLQTNGNMNRRSSVSLATHFVLISCQIIIISLSLHPILLQHPSYHALVAELADAPDLGSGVPRREGSSPFRRTIQNPNCLIISKRLGFFFIKR